MARWLRWCWLSAALAFVPCLVLAAPGEGPTRETVCDDGKDDDGDTVYDCGDDDCAEDPACRPDGGRETGEQRCADWIDNDEDGYLDCDDVDCDGAEACKGSWDLDEEPAASLPESASSETKAEVPELRKGESPEDLIGRGGDNDGERSNYMCSDGIDNDGDGRIDCEDLGCRLDTQITVCQPSGNFRFSLVGRVEQSYEVQEERFNTQFSALQMRVLGQMPFIQNSFFLLSMRAEKTPRLTFATFQVPIKNGHYVNINSGGGGLSLELVRSVHKRMLGDPAYYVYNAFEQGNGAALEFGGPFDKKGKFLYRTFVAGGSGRFAGNVGGTFFPDGNTNYTWTAGAQLHMNLVGYYNRFDSPMLYTPARTTFTLTFGGKYDQRAQERYPAVNLQSVFRWKRLILLAEAYGKRELNFRNWQLAYNVQAGILVVKKRLLLAGDFGSYIASEFEDPPEELGSDLRRQLQELQYRVAAHVYVWRDIFLVSAVWRDRRVEAPPTDPMPGLQTQQDARLMATYRF